MTASPTAIDGDCLDFNVYISSAKITYILFNKTFLKLHLIDILKISLINVLKLCSSKCFSVNGIICTVKEWCFIIKDIAARENNF